MGEQVQPPRGNNKREHLTDDVRRGLKIKEQQPPATTKPLDYNVMRDGYDGFICQFRELLAAHPNPSCVEGHPVLPRQTSRHPARWMFVNLTCEGKEVMKTTLAIRDDNLYLKAFRNQKGEWYELGVSGANKKLLPEREYGSKFLECGDDYGSLLVDGGKDSDKVKGELLRLELGWNWMMGAVRKLACYEQGSLVGVDAVDPTLKRELARLIVMICEPARMIKHYDTVKSGWDEQSQITELEVYYIWNWGNMSGALLECMRNTSYKWPNQEIFCGKPNIRNKDEALQVVHLVKDTWPPEKKREQQQQQNQKRKKQKPPSPPPPADGDKDADGPPYQAPPPADNNKAVHGQPQPPSFVGGKQHEGEASSSQQVQATTSTSFAKETAAGTRCCGRRLVEVFALTVSAGSGADKEFPLIGTNIAVFDGKRGQIIYKHDKEEDDHHTKDPKKLVLTGPHTAISADRSFTVEIEIPTTTTTTDDEPSTTCWEWDCFDEEIEYNEQYTENLGPVDITYAVLSDALEATVEIKLQPLSRESLRVFGSITASIRTFAAASVLFSRASKEKAVQLPSNYIVPLARSVIAVPSESMVRIVVKLSAENPDHAVKDFFVDVEFDCRSVHSKPIPTLNGHVQVNISWYPQFTECEETRRSSPSETNRTDADLVYNVVDGDYATFMTEFRALLADHPHREDYEGHHVLARQSATQPGRWIHIKLVAGEETTTLAIRDDNVYLKGFRNKEGQWYELSGPTERSARMLPREYNSSLLGWCDVGYRSILGVDKDQRVLEILTSVMLDKRFVIEAVHSLSDYREEVTVDAVRLALAGLIIIVCESARMSKLYHTISGRSGKLSMWQVYYLWNWKRMSRVLLQRKSSSNSIWPRRDPQLEPLGITSAHETLRLVELLLNWSVRARAAAGLGNGIGRQRVELLAVRADFSLPAGTTITVFDGKRGQIIYRHQQADEHSSVLDYQGNLVLSGPYQAISADGCFAIHVEMPTAAQGADGVRVAVWEWDGYDKPYADQVDSPIPSHHTINIGPGRTIYVAYAVMSNAVETTVQVRLPIARGTLVYGQITAYIQGFERILGSVLFSSSTAANAVPVNPADSTVPLARSVVALQYGKPVYIQMKLHAVTNQGVKDFEGSVTFKGGVHSSAENLDTRHGTVRVNITCHPKIPAPRGCV